MWRICNECVMIDFDLFKYRAQCGECVMIDFNLSKYRAQRDECVANIYDIDLKVANLGVIKICSIKRAIWRND